MYAGHMDEVGFIVHYIDDTGFLFFSTIGGTDVAKKSGSASWSMDMRRCRG